MTKSSTENSTTNYTVQQTTVLDSVGASTKEVCWLPTTVLSTTGEQVLKTQLDAIVPAQQENKG
jgi:hypothetical protein